MPNTARVALAAAVALALLTGSGRAITIDGQLDAGYGAAIVTQTLQTGLAAGQITGDATDNDLNIASGSELDVCHATISNGVLYLFLGGNIATKLNNNQNDTIGHILDIFFDTQLSGQNQLNGLGSGNPLNGLTFDSDFHADYWLELYGDAVHGPSWVAGRGVIDSPGSGTFTSLGVSTAGGPGTLTGGSNPFGIQVTIDNRNTAGANFGCSTSSGAGVTKGIEWAIPLTAIGNPPDCFLVTAFLRNRGSTGSMSNSVLAPLPPGSCPPGQTSTVNFRSIAGDQFFQFCASTDVATGANGSLAFLDAGPNPTRGENLRVSFSLPDARPGRLTLVDCAGRIVREQTVSAAAGSRGVVDLTAGARLRPGLYWLRLTQNETQLARKVCVIR